MAEFINGAGVHGRWQNSLTALEYMNKWQTSLTALEYKDPPEKNTPKKKGGGGWGGGVSSQKMAAKSYYLISATRKFTESQARSCMRQTNANTELLRTGKIRNGL